jgi:hypothetical protein
MACSFLDYSSKESQCLNKNNDVQYHDLILLAAAVEPFAGVVEWCRRAGGLPVMAFAAPASIVLGT